MSRDPPEPHEAAPRPYRPKSGELVKEVFCLQGLPAEKHGNFNVNNEPADCIRLLLVPGNEWVRYETEGGRT